MEMLKWFCAESSGHDEDRPCKTFSYMQGSWLKAGSQPPQWSTQQPAWLLLYEGRARRTRPSHQGGSLRMSLSISVSGEGYSSAFVPQAEAAQSQGRG